jgi:hypothetical protein
VTAFATHIAAYNPVVTWARRLKTIFGNALGAAFVDAMSRPSTQAEQLTQTSQENASASGGGAFFTSVREHSIIINFKKYCV